MKWRFCMMVANTHIFTRAFSVTDCIDALSCAALKGAFFVAATAFDVAIAAQVVAIAAHSAAIAASHSEDIEGQKVKRYHNRDKIKEWLKLR